MATIHHLTMRIIKDSVEAKLSSGVKMEANVASVVILTMDVENMKLQEVMI